MRIVIIGQAAFGAESLQALEKMGEEVVGVYMPPDVPGREDPFKELAVERGIAVFQPEEIRAPEVYEEYIKLKPELNVMAFVTSIVPESILNYPVMGTIQYHPSLLPRHRGGSAINWAIINGEAKTGVTISWPDRGIDTGPILMQEEVEISPDDTVGSLYFDRLFPLGIELLGKSVELIRRGIALRMPQDESQASYEGLCTAKDAVVNWSRPVSRVYDLIRGTNPQPGATTRFGDSQFKLFDVELMDGGVDKLPGEIVDIGDRGFVVAAAGGAVLIKRVQAKGSGKVAAVEFAGQVNLKVGDRLGAVGS